MMSRSSAECRYSLGTCRRIGSTGMKHERNRGKQGSSRRPSRSGSSREQRAAAAHRAEEVHAALVDAQDQLGRQQADGVLNALQGAGRAGEDGGSCQCVP